MSLRPLKAGPWRHDDYVESGLIPAMPASEGPWGTAQLVGTHDGISIGYDSAETQEFDAISPWDAPDDVWAQRPTSSFPPASSDDWDATC